jgi:hypothetical protein
MPVGVSAPEHGGPLPIGTEHGLAHRFGQYPHTLIYADLSGRPLRLVGVMISMPRWLRGPAVGGPIRRWHDHLLCAACGERGLAPRPDGSCPAGAKLGVGSEMMHVWFTRDPRTVYAIHAPWPELCAARLLPAATCASGERSSECSPDQVARRATFGSRRHCLGR